MDIFKEYPFTAQRNAYQCRPFVCMASHSVDTNPRDKLDISQHAEDCFITALFN